MSLIRGKRFYFGRIFMSPQAGCLTLIAGIAGGTVLFVLLRGLSEGFAQFVAWVFLISFIVFVLYRRVVVTTYSCPDCMGDVNPRARVCPHCGLNLDSS